MKKSMFLLAALAMLPLQTWAADVGVSISVGQPGFYGQIDIGNYPRPVLVNPKPVVVRSAPGVLESPIYLHVPPGHAKRWQKYCHRYNACGRPVYFVQDRWYNEVYVPHYRERHDGKYGREDQGWHGHDRADHGRGHGHGQDRD